MRTQWGRLLTAVAGGFAAVVFAAGPAWADTVIPLHAGQAPTTATGFSAHMCEANFGGGPYATQDVWVFVLPDNASMRDFVSVTANFSTGTLSAPANGGISDDNGTSKAWILAPAGATLLSASAVVTGSADPSLFFNITHTCPATGASPSPSTSLLGSPPASPSPSPSFPSPSPFGGGGGSPSPSSSLSPSSRGGGGSGGSPSAGSSTSPNGSTGPQPSGAPNTGGGGTQTTANVILGGGALLGSLAAGGILFALRRRRNVVG